MAGNLRSKDRVDYIHFIVLPLKMVACWDWYPNPDREYKILLNNIYLALVLFVLVNFPITLIVNLYTEWVDIMGSLDKLADGLPLLVSVAVVIYFALHKKELYELVDFMNENFTFHSARGLTNMTMERSYKSAKNFSFVYTACTLFSVTMYVTLPMIIHVWTHQPLQNWIFMDVSRMPAVALAFLRQCFAQALLGLAVGQLGVFFAANAILLCGQLDLLCCSLRNTRFTALLQAGVQHKALLQRHSDIVDDERHNYIYSAAELKDSQFHYDGMVTSHFVDRRSEYDIYSSEFDAATMDALRDCAKVCQTVATYKEKLEAFVSPLLALRVVQVTLYLCTLLYAASVKFELITVEYLAAVALDIFVYCYFGNQIILQNYLMVGGTKNGDRIPEGALSVLPTRWRDDLVKVSDGYATRRTGLCGVSWALMFNSAFLSAELNFLVHQASRVSTAAYQSAWVTMGARPRRTLLNILLANLRPVTLRAGGFLPMDLHTFVVIIKTSFSYYTLLDKINH